MEDTTLKDFFIFSEKWIKASTLSLCSYRQFAKADISKVELKADERIFNLIGTRINAEFNKN